MRIVGSLWPHLFSVHHEPAITTAPPSWHFITINTATRTGMSITSRTNESINNHLLGHRLAAASPPQTVVAATALYHHKGWVSLLITTSKIKKNTTGTPAVATAEPLKSSAATLPRARREVARTQHVREEGTGRNAEKVKMRQNVVEMKVQGEQDEAWNG